MEDCSFCRIIAHHTHANILYEDDDARCILNMNPIHFGHPLVIPTRHCRGFMELRPESFSGVIQALHSIVRAPKTSLALECFNPHPRTGKITEVTGMMNIPDKPIMPFNKGDGTCPDIWRASQRSSTPQYRTRMVERGRS